MPPTLPETLNEIDAQIDLIQKLKEINELLDAIKQGAKVVKGGVTGDRAADETLGQVKALLDQLSGKLAALTERLGAMEKMVSGLANTIQALSTLAQAVARAKEASGAELIRALGDFIWQWRGAMAFLARSLGSLNPIITAYLIVLTKGAEGIAQALEIAEEAIAENRAKLREAYEAVDEALGREVHIDPEDPDEIKRLERELEEQLARLLAERDELLRQADEKEWEAARAAARRDVLAGQDISGWIDGYLDFVRKFLPDATMPEGYNTRHRMTEEDYEALKEIQRRLQRLIEGVMLDLQDPTKHNDQTRAEFFNSADGKEFQRLNELYGEGQKKLNEIETAIQKRAIEILRQHRPQVLERAGLASASQQSTGFFPVDQEISFFQRTGVRVGGGMVAALLVVAIVFAFCLRPESVTRTAIDGTNGEVMIPAEFSNLASILGLAGFIDSQILEFIESLTSDEAGDFLYSISTVRPGDPAEDVDVRNSGTGRISMDSVATDLAFNFSTLPCNAAAEVNVACVSQGPIPAGDVVLAVTIVEGDIPKPGADREYVYGAVFEATGNPSDDFHFEPPFDWDFYQNTETWHELVLPAGSNQWQARATRWNGTRQEPRPSAARVAFAGDAIVWFIPAAELATPEPTARLTAFRHDGSFLPEKSAGDVSGVNPTVAPVSVKSTGIAVKGKNTRKAASPSPAAQETVQEFFAKFGEAFRTGDENFFFDRLAPQVIELYGEEQCRAQTERQQGSGGQFEVRNVQGPQAAEVTLDDRKIPVPDALVVDLVIRSGTQERTQTSHVILIDGLVRWFTDCGNPL